MGETDLRQVRRATLRDGLSELVVHMRVAEAGSVTLWLEGPMWLGEWRAALALDGSLSAEPGWGRVRGYHISDAVWSALVAEGDIAADEATGHAFLTEDGRAQLGEAVAVVTGVRNAPLAAWAESLGTVLRNELGAGDGVDAFLWSCGPDGSECVSYEDAMSAQPVPGARTRLLPALKRLHAGYQAGEKLLAVFPIHGRVIDDLMDSVRFAREWGEELAGSGNVVIGVACVGETLAEPERQALESLSRPDTALTCSVVRADPHGPEAAFAVVAELLGAEDIVVGGVTVTCEGERVPHSASGRAMGVPRRIEFALPDGERVFELRVEQAEDGEAVEKCYTVDLEEWACRPDS